MPQEELSAYLVEIAPSADSVEAGSLASRARSSADGVRFLRSIYVPEDDRWFLLYKGASAEEVAAAVRRADAVVVSIAEARGAPGEIPELTDVSASSGSEAGSASKTGLESRQRSRPWRVDESVEEDR